jgi:putative transposase
VKHKRAYHYRFYPTDGQKNILARTFGCCRVVYNWALGVRTDAYSQRHERLSLAESCKRLTQLKKQPEYNWLNEVSSVPLQQELRHLDTAFVNFFEGRAQYPKFHKKHEKQAATYMSNAFTLEGTTLTLAMMDKQPLDIRWSRPLPKNVQPTSVTVSKDSLNHYFVSILLEEEITPMQSTSNTIGVDLGLKSFVVLSSGETVGNPRFFHKDEKRLARAQRRHAKKKKGSRNKEKARLKVARIHARIADRRCDFQHQLSTRVIRENQVICVESLTVKNMVQNHCLAKSISDVGWGSFVRQLEYKAQWYGRTLVKIDQWYPSSKRCFGCGHVLPSLDLSVREWTCPQCQRHHDRDLNASYNIHAAGLAVYACGESVRPGAVKTKSGNSRRSRKAKQ